MQVQTIPGPLMDYAVYDECLILPPDYGNETAALRPYLELIESAQVMQAFTRDLGKKCEGRLIPLLELLNDRITEFNQQDVRLEGSAHTPTETLRKGSGVCRDLALLFIAACRHLGIAARFVSGYQRQPAGDDHEKRYLHAWAEVYLPRLGWQGYDQTHGSTVADEHVVVASGAAQTNTMPVEGSFIYAGSPPKSILETDIRIRTQ